MMELVEALSGRPAKAKETPTAAWQKFRDAIGI